VLAGRITHHLDRIDHGHRLALQQGDQLGNRGNAEHIDASDEFRLSGLAQRHDHPPKTCLLGRKSRGQNATDWPDPTVQPQLTQQHSSAQFIGAKDPLSRKDCSDNREVKMREKPYLKVVAAAGAAEQFRRYGTSGLMPGVRRVRTSSSATRISLMLLSWETRRITLKAWSASIL
jgi:hypothetical protein